MPVRRVTTALDFAGLALVVTAGWVFAGLGLALFLAGLAVLVVSWRLTQ